MKKKLFIGALALLSVFAMVLTSCDNDDVTPRTQNSVMATTRQVSSEVIFTLSVTLSQVQKSVLSKLPY